MNDSLPPMVAARRQPMPRAREAAANASRITRQRDQSNVQSEAESGGVVDGSVSHSEATSATRRAATNSRSPSARTDRRSPGSTSRAHDSGEASPTRLAARRSRDG